MNIHAIITQCIMILCIRMYMCRCAHMYQRLAAHTTDSIHDITDVQKTTSKPRGIQIACRITYEILAKPIAISLAGLYCIIRELQCIQYFKSVFLEILIMTIRSVFINQITIDN